MTVKHHDVVALGEEIESMGMRKWLMRELAWAFREARKNKLKTFNEHQYEVNWMENVAKLTDAIMERTYKPSGSVSFIIYDPMVREIFAAPFIDRVVHHFLYEICGGWWDRHFIYDSYSCRDDKGTLLGILRVQKMMRRASENLTKDAYVVKLDIKGYFMSLPRKELYEEVKWGLDQQFGADLDQKGVYDLYKLCIYLWRMVLLDDPVQKSYRRGPLRNWNDLPPEKSLYTRDPGLGIVIGNLTSQLVSNIYLNRLDRYIKYDLGYQYYGRYVDDFVIIVPADKYAQLLKDIKKIEKFLRVELRMVLHKKKRYVQHVKKGVNFLGARVYPYCIYPSNRVQSKFREELRKYLKYGQNQEKLTSYMGLIRHMDAGKFVKREFDKYGLDFDLFLESESEDRRSFDEILWELRERVAGVWG